MTRLRRSTKQKTAGEGSRRLQPPEFGGDAGWLVDGQLLFNGQMQRQVQKRIGLGRFGRVIAAERRLDAVEQRESALVVLEAPENEPQMMIRGQVARLQRERLLVGLERAVQVGEAAAGLLRQDLEGCDVPDLHARLHPGLGPSREHHGRAEQQHTEIHGVAHMGVDAVRDERRIGALIRDQYPECFLGHLPVYLSHEISPKAGEYRRSMTVVIDAYLRDLSESHLLRLADDLRQRGYQRPLFVAKNTGGLSSLSRSQALHLLGSSPSATVIGADYLGGLMGESNIIISDMGGTSFDVGLVVEGALPRATRPRCRACSTPARPTSARSRADICLGILNCPATT